jgi:hypothetical protein
MATSFVEWAFVSCPENVNAVNYVCICFWFVSSLSKFIDHFSQDGNTPLHLACQKNNSEVVELLLQRGKAVNTNVRNKVE